MDTCGEEIRLPRQLGPLRTGSIPFEITTRTDDFYNPANQQRLLNSINRLEQGLGTEHELIEADE